MPNIKIKVTPSSKKNEVIGEYIDEKGEKCLKVKISAPAVDGKANEKLIEFLSEYFKVKKSQVKILRGEKNNIKIISVN
jgi:uncharacterized protein